MNSQLFVDSVLASMRATEATPWPVSLQCDS